MGLFDKKYCDICGEKIGLLGNRKLEDGNLCKDCAKQLSPWFSDRRRGGGHQAAAGLPGGKPGQGVPVPHPAPMARIVRSCWTRSIVGSPLPVPGIWRTPTRIFWTAPR